MSATAKKTDPKLWNKVKRKVTEGDKGGKPGQWSARKAQMAVSAYKEAGGGYQGKRSDDNHLRQWTKEEWGTKTGKQSGKTGERYLPKEAREQLSKGEYARTTAAKRRDSRRGKQFSRQPADVARKTRPYRENGSNGHETKAALYARAKAQNIAGRSRMSRDELQRAVG